MYDISPWQHALNARGFLWTLSKRFGVAMPLYKGTFGFVPKRVPVDVIFGEPFEPTCAARGKPTDEEVQAAHAEYVRRLRKCFDENKEALGYGDRELIVS